MIALKAKPETERAADLVEVQLHLQCIARSEIVRYRNQLASLSADQKSAVEEVLLSMVDAISVQVATGIQSYPEAVRKQTVSVWRGAFPACVNAKTLDFKKKYKLLLY